MKSFYLNRPVYLFIQFFYNYSHLLENVNDQELIEIVVINIGRGNSGPLPKELQLVTPSFQRSN